jgi:ABC-type amino acid transport substrate-binding protein
MFRYFIEVLKDTKLTIIYLLLAIIAFCFIFIVFNQYQLPNPIVIGVRTSAIPFGYNVEYDKVSGFCGVFGKELKKVINSPVRLFKIDVKYRNVENDYLKAGYDRYDGLKNNRIHVECGANSIESGELESSHKKKFKSYIQFSKSFYTTGIKLLLRKELSTLISKKSSYSPTYSDILSEVNVGVVKRTTTYAELEKYKLKYLLSYPTRQDALNSLGRDKNAAYASDAIILMTLFKEGQKTQAKGGIILKNPIPAYEKYQYEIYPKDNYLNGKSWTEDYAIAISKDKLYSNDLTSYINDILDNNLQINIAKKNLRIYEENGLITADPIETDNNAFTIAIILIIIFILALLAFLKNKSGVKSGIHIHSIYNVIKSQIAAMGDSAQAKENKFSRKNQNANDDKKDS